MNDEHRIRNDACQRSNDRVSVTPGVYASLVLHQCNTPWKGREVMNALHEWAVRFNVQFKLQIPEITLCLDTLPAHVGGQFRYDYNGLGLRGEITINSRYLELPWWWLLSVLLHELLHGWQQAYGAPSRGNYHNRQYRDKAAEFGLIIDERGRQSLLKDSKFFQLLAEHGMELPEFGTQEDGTEEARRARLDEINRRRPKGRSKLKKWSCGCRPAVNVRVAVADFYAQCLKCGQVFRLQEADGRQSEMTQIPEA